MAAVLLLGEGGLVIDDFSLLDPLVGGSPELGRNGRFVVAVDGSNVVLEYLDEPGKVTASNAGSNGEARLLATAVLLGEMSAAIAALND